MATAEKTTNPQAPVQIGINDQDRQEIAHGLSRLLADSYLLYLKTHNFHWNVTGPQFHSLHEMFEEQYTELAQAVDTIAERIRTIGYQAPGSYSEFGELASVQETRGAPEAQEMVRLLVEGNETVVRTAREVLSAAERANDESTTDLLMKRMRTHEKTAWMLRSTVQ
ncbi:MAG: DNA starvation/stationary phase protection protein [Cyanobacteria bacterium QH_8_48_120]|jgi:starvation-inducible DNA-binding protein|nr:MAG: DNA starvation/stationary phase protection protein [Cyanobacteria bacterium QH_1_48_107]PSO71956.1 MAG: DNA starvation/stationary phase protection protein [Cyanobacteria bacterium QH_8_48_120]